MVASRPLCRARQPEDEPGRLPAFNGFGLAATGRGGMR